MSAKLSFGWEKLEALLREPNLREMIEDYELEHRSPVLAHLPVDIDWPRLLAQEASGVYRIWAVRVDGTLAGFITWYVEPHPYYRTVLAAVDGGHFLAPAFRNKGRIGWGMWRSAFAALRREGVRFAMPHDSTRRPMTPFLLAFGAEPLSTWWILDLAHENS